MRVLPRLILWAGVALVPLVVACASSKPIARSDDMPDVRSDRSNNVEEASYGDTGQEVEEKDADSFLALADHIGDWSNGDSVSEVAQDIPSPDAAPDQVVPPDLDSSHCPVAVIKSIEGSQVAPQTVVHLVGSQSYSPNGEIVKWVWSVEQPPLSGSIFVPSSIFADPVFELNVAGLYTFSLDVWDSTGTKSCVPATYEILNCGCVDFHVELVWRTPGDPDESDQEGTDLNLHLAHPLASMPDLDGDGEADPWYDALYDCFWFNPNPDWSPSSPQPHSCPQLDLDDVDGAGPENINYDTPDSNIYRVGVDFWDDHGFGPAFATVRVYAYGVMIFESPEVYMTSKDMWDVCTIHWPSGSVTPVVGPDGGQKIAHDYVSDDLVTQNQP